MVKRHVPAEIRKELRREVNWGCPVRNCGSPFLTWHHFEPTYAELERTGGHHDPEGMIALCSNHASRADGGEFTDDQLRTMKRKPFLTGAQVGERNRWLRRDVIVRAGSNTFVNISSLIRINGSNVIWFTRGPDENLELSMNIVDGHGNPMFIMEKNDWIALGPLEDVEVPPRGREIFVKSKANGFWLRLQFKNLGKDRFRREIEETAVAMEKRQLERQNEHYTFLRERFPDVADRFSDITMSLVEEATIRQEVWQRVEKNISGGPALEIVLRGCFPPPAGMVSSGRSLRVGEASASGNLFMGRFTVFSFDADGRLRIGARGN